LEGKKESIMFNPEKILGSMLRSGMRRKSGLGGLVSGGAALGLVGVAMEAVEHFMNNPKGEQRAPSGGAPPAHPGAPVPTPKVPGKPPQPAGGQNAQHSAAPMPPPPPGQSSAASPSPAPPETDTPSNDAILLIRAMIAAANADGIIDEKERNNILNKLQKVQLTSEEHAFVVHELLAPKDMADIVAEVKSPAMAKQVYTVSQMAIEVDTAAERDYMLKLSEHLGLSASDIDQIREELR
jgi:hypothetical protein